MLIIIHWQSNKHLSVTQKKVRVKVKDTRRAELARVKRKKWMDSEDAKTDPSEEQTWMWISTRTRDEKGKKTKGKHFQNQN